MASAPVYYKAMAAIRAFAGIAKPSPKMGQALGPLGINMMQFCKDFNAKTSHIRQDVPMRINVYSFTDRSYEMQIKPPETVWFLKRVTGVQKFSNMPGRFIHFEVPIFYVYEIAKIKKELDPDHCHLQLNSIMRMIIGQCRSCGLSINTDTQKPQPFAPKLKI